MATMKQCGSQTFWREFLALYRQMPEIWKVKSDVYKDRNKKNESYKVLVRKMKEIDPAADKDAVRSKINSFRASYRREIKKIKDSLRSGRGSGNVYVPSLWYFEDLNFLRDQTFQEEEMYSMESPEQETENGEDEDELASEVNSEDVDYDQTSYPKRKHSHTPLGSKRRLLAYERLRGSNSEWNIAAKGWALQLAKMDPSQQLYAKKFIDDVIFEGRMGNLNRYSVSINQTPEPVVGHSFHYAGASYQTQERAGSGSSSPVDDYSNSTPIKIVYSPSSSHRGSAEKNTSKKMPVQEIVLANEEN